MPYPSESEPYCEPRHHVWVAQKENQHFKKGDKCDCGKYTWDLRPREYSIYLELPSSRFPSGGGENE